MDMTYEEIQRELGIGVEINWAVDIIEAAELSLSLVSLDAHEVRNFMLLCITCPFWRKKQHFASILNASSYH